MTRVLVTFSMLAKIGWAKPTRKINPGAASNDMAVIYALEIFNLALVDLKRYFYYDNDLMHVLQYSADESEAPLSFDSSSYSTNDPTFSNNKI
jgi:hypothetical protein